MEYALRRGGAILILVMYDGGRQFFCFSMENCDAYITSSRISIHHFVIYFWSYFSCAQTILEEAKYVNKLLRTVWPLTISVLKGHECAAVYDGLAKLTGKAKYVADEVVSPLEEHAWLIVSDCWDRTVVFSLGYKPVFFDAIGYKPVVFKDCHCLVYR